MGYSDEEVAQIIATVIFAGFEYTSTGISCAMYRIAFDQELQEN